MLVLTFQIGAHISPYSQKECLHICPFWSNTFPPFSIVHQDLHQSMEGFGSPFRTSHILNVYNILMIPSYNEQDYDQVCQHKILGLSCVGLYFLHATILFWDESHLETRISQLLSIYLISVPRNDIHVISLYGFP